jgi:hypothetical protein
LTPTSTPIYTPSNTFTDTPTISPTPTLTPTPAGAPFNVILYPNSATGPTVIMQISLQGLEDVKVKIFTVTGRRVRNTNFYGVPTGVNELQLVLEDDWGCPLANGLYFFQIQAGSDKTIYKLIVAR